MNTINVRLMRDDDYCNGRSTLLTMSERSFRKLLKESVLNNVRVFRYDNSMYFYHDKLGLHIHIDVKDDKFRVAIKPGYVWIY